MKIPVFTSLGKYRDLLLAIALFLVLDLGVLVFNFQSSRLIEEDTRRIDMTGDMRVFSQQLAKAVVTLRQEIAVGEPTQTSVAQMSEAYAAFEKAFAMLGDTLRGHRREWFDDHARIEQARTLYVELGRTWEPLALIIRPLVDNASGLQLPDSGMLVNIEIAATKVVARNIRLMQQADDLGRHLEEMAVQRAGQMRTIQLAAIVLALINFVFIAFKFLRSLMRSDAAASHARDEIERILGAVREGLFLLDRNGRVGALQSSSTPVLLGLQLVEGDKLFACLASRMPADEIKAAEKYVNVLFKEQVSGERLKSLNPMRVVAFKAKDGRQRFLDFEFQQVWNQGRVMSLLVSVSDITEKAGLASELAQIKDAANVEVESLLSILDGDPEVVVSFLETADNRLRLVNSQLKKFGVSETNGRPLVGQLLALVSDVVKSSGALGLHAIHGSAQSFERHLIELHGRLDFGRIDLIPVVVALNDLLDEVEKFRKVGSRLQAFSIRNAPANLAQDALGEAVA